MLEVAMNIIYQCLLIACLVVEIFASTAIPLIGNSKVLSDLLPSVPTFVDIAVANGFRCKKYDVTTSDGYILGLFRIPGDKRRPVLLMHGILDSADTFIIRGNESLALALARAGYDVWAGNSRGNRYSRRHLNLNPDTDAEFWNYSFHEMGHLDLPSIIDLILNRTNQPGLSAVGHSEGTTIFYVLGSTRPEFNTKINVLASLAPVAQLQHAKSLLAGLIKLAPMINGVIESAHYEEILGFNSNLKAILRTFCGDPKRYLICSRAIIFPLVGKDPDQLEPDFLPTLMAHYPAGTSRKTLVHYAQVGNRGVFAQFDFGSYKNLKIYGSSNPPEYNLSKVSFPVALYLGANDYISTAEDVEVLKKQLPQVVEYRVLDYPSWNHMDHMFGKFVPKYLLPMLLKLLNNYLN